MVITIIEVEFKIYKVVLMIGVNESKYQVVCVVSRKWYQVRARIILFKNLSMFELELDVRLIIMLYALWHEVQAL